MRRGFWFVTLAALTGGGLFLLAGGTGLLWTAGPEVQRVPSGDAEIAWIYPATSSGSWERFVAGARHAATEVDGLEIIDKDAFPNSTTAVPELILRREGVAGQIHIRWYKETSRTDAAAWVRALAHRDPAPLAIIGGNTSDRARSLATELAADSNLWHGSPPLLMLTTATAVNFRLYETEGSYDPDLLMKLYPGRTFRFCYNNLQMVRAVQDFLASREDLRPTDGVFYLNWEDDSYSTDLYWHFHTEIKADDRFKQLRPDQLSIEYTTGEYDQPNLRERAAVERLLEFLGDGKGRAGGRSVLVLPAGSVPARRVLKELCSRDPLIGARLVVVTGDSISWNTVYRDRGFAWDVRELPVPVIFFAHRNPVAWDQVPDAKPNSTSDLLLYSDIVRGIAETAFVSDDTGPPRLVADADQMAERLHRCGKFDASGDRLEGTGECVVCVRPEIDPTASPGRRIGTETDYQVYRKNSISRPASEVMGCIWEPIEWQTKTD